MRYAEAFFVVLSSIEKTQDENGNFPRSAQTIVYLMHLAYTNKISLSEFSERITELKESGEETFGAEEIQ